MRDKYDTHLFSYRFDGKEWGFDLKARNAAEARARLHAICAWAKYDGILEARVPYRLGFFAKAYVALRNLFCTTD